MYRLALLFFFLPTLALAEPITVTLDDQDQSAIATALDAYVKRDGLNVSLSAVIIMQKMQAALKAAQLETLKKDQPK